jgi:tRNA(Ile)-lysidine synthase
VPLIVERVEVSRAPRTSLENEARRVRYSALAQAAALTQTRFVALAHHRDDQAETLLLMLLRGAGPTGLAAMPALRDDARGVAWWRPFLNASRADIDDYTSAARLEWVDDESNARTRHLRNAVRHEVMPLLSRICGDPAATLARAAAHQAEAAQLADDLAAIDAQHAFDGATLAREALAALPAHRARNLLRWFLSERGLAMPSAARLSAMLSQVTRARGDAQVRIVHDGAQIGVFRGRVVVHAPPPPPFDVAWSGEERLALPHGSLAFARAKGEGIDLRRIDGLTVHVRERRGGERLQLAANRPRRALKAILHEAGLPPWERQCLPLVYVGDDLAAVPGIGVDVLFAAPPGFAGVTLTWRPDAQTTDQSA